MSYQYGTSTYDPYSQTTYYDPYAQNYSSHDPYADVKEPQPYVPDDSDTDDEPIVLEKPQELPPPEVVQVEQKRLAARNKKILYGGLGAIGLLAFLIGIIFVIKKLRAGKKPADEEQHVRQYIPEKKPQESPLPSYQQSQTHPGYHGTEKGGSQQPHHPGQPQQFSEKAAPLSYGSQVRPEKG